MKNSMKYRFIICICLAMTLLLGGCSLYDGRYVHVVPHQFQAGQSQSQTLRAANYEQLCDVLGSLVADGTTNAAILIDLMPEGQIDSILSAAADYIRNEHPVGAFALDDIVMEVGTSRGNLAVAADLTYHRSTVEIRQVIYAGDISQARSEIEQALASYRPRIALSIAQYQPTDFAQMVTDLSRENIQTIMECPHVAEEVYGSGDARLVELNFTYENSRDALRAMQVQVQPIFNAASLYVSGDSAPRQKYAQLYAFLMERFDYTLETSITPAYSLLQHGVGDSRTFALVYAAMCRNAELPCDVITGTRYGEPWVWNRIQDEENEYYVDLIRCAQGGGFWEMKPSDLNGYVWDYSELAQPEQTAEEDEIK